MRRNTPGRNGGAGLRSVFERAGLDPAETEAELFAQLDTLAEFYRDGPEPAPLKASPTEIKSDPAIWAEAEATVALLRLHGYQGPRALVNPAFNRQHG